MSPPLMRNLVRGHLLDEFGEALLHPEHSPPLRGIKERDHGEIDQCRPGLAKEALRLLSDGNAPIRRFSEPVVEDAHRILRLDDGFIGHARRRHPTYLFSAAHPVGQVGCRVSLNRILRLIVHHLFLLELAVVESGDRERHIGSPLRNGEIAFLVLLNFFANTYEHIFLRRFKGQIECGAVIESVDARIPARARPDSEIASAGVFDHFVALIFDVDFVFLPFDQRLRETGVERAVLVLLLLNVVHFFSAEDDFGCAQRRQQSEPEYSLPVNQGGEGQFAGGRQLVAADDRFDAVVFGVNDPFVFIGARGSGLPFTFEVRQVPDALLLAGHVIVDQRDLFGRHHLRHRAIRADVEPQIVMPLAVDVGAEEGGALRVVEIAERRGVYVLDILARIHRLYKAARRFSVSAHPVAEIPERVFHSGIGRALLTRGFDRLQGVVSEVNHQTVERLDDSVLFSEQREVFLFYVDNRSEREFAVAGEDADGHLAKNGREKTDATTAERDDADVAFQREICHFVCLGEIAVAQGAIVRIDVRRNRPFIGHGDFGAYLRCFEFDFDGSGFVAFDFDVAFRGFEPVAFNSQFVAARRKFFDFELSLFVGDGVAHGARLFIANADLRAGDHRAVRILDRSGDYSGLGLRRNDVQRDGTEYKEQ